MSTRIVAFALCTFAVAACASPEPGVAEGLESSTSRMDKNRILIELSEGPRTHYGRIPYEEQSKAQQVFSAIWALESEVNNGGFAQYFANSSGDTAVHAESALRAIGAHRAADIVARAVALFPGGPPSTDRDGRGRRIDGASPEIHSAWDRLDQQFYAYPDDLTSLLYEWVKGHPEEFGDVP
jgi:hypothetical protein